MTFRRAALALIVILNFAAFAVAQGRGGRGIPNATPEQTAAVTRMNAAVAAETERLSAARADLLAASFAAPRNDAAIQAKVDAIRAAELQLARARADAFGKLQASPTNWPPNRSPPWLPERADAEDAPPLAPACRTLPRNKPSRSPISPTAGRRCRKP